MQQRGASVVIDRAAALEVSPTIDVTAQVLAIMNQNTAPFNVNAPAQAAPGAVPARPATAPPPVTTRRGRVRRAADAGERRRPAIGPLDIRRVMAALPHRYPMLLVDRVEELVPTKRIVAIKAVTINEGFFQGHFPDRPIMPGVLIVEAMAQAAGVLAVESLGLAGSGKLVYFMAIDGAKFRAPVEPGVLLRIEVEFVQKRGDRLQVRGQGLCRRQARRPGRFHGDDRGSAGGLTARQAPPAPLDPENLGRCGGRRGPRRRCGRGP